MAKKLYDLLVKTGTYEKDGETKNNYLNIGVVLEGDKGPYMLLSKTFNPAGVVDERTSVMVGMFSKQEKSQSAKETTVSQEDIAWQD